MRDALDALERTGSLTSEAYADVALLWAESRLQRGDAGEAALWRTHARETRARLLGPEHPRTQALAETPRAGF